MAVRAGACALESLNASLVFFFLRLNHRLRNIPQYLSQRSDNFLIHSWASIMASATPAAAAPHHSTAALEARSLRGLRREAERCHMAETVSKAHALPPRVVAWELGAGKSTLSGPLPHRRGRLFCLGASAHSGGHSPQARTGASPHDCFAHHVTAAFVAVIGGWDHGVAPPISRWGSPQAPQA